jgi:hypothetical protein
MTNLPLIIDNLIEIDLQNKIEDSIFDCFWTYYTDVTLGSKESKMEYRKFLSPLDYKVSPSFITDIRSPLNRGVYDKIIPLIREGCNEIGFKLEKIERCYGVIHALMRDKIRNDNIHVNIDIPHLVMLYYVNDCDGDTILYDKTLDDIPFDIDYPEDYYELNIQHKVTPKKGRILFFDGKVYHSSSSPNESIRCIITLNLFGEFADGSYKFPAPKETIKNNFVYQ